VLTGRGFPRTRACIIPPGVDTSRFRPGLDASPVVARHGLDGKDVVLHVGRLAREKNLELVLRAWPAVRRALPSAHLFVVGGGPARDFYEGLARKHGLTGSVTFAGFVPDEDLPACYSAARCLVLASKFETQGLVLFEAMACGVPCAGIRFRAVAEAIRDGVDGALFDATPDACAAAVVRCVRDRAKLSRSARASAEKLSVEAQTDRLIALYRRLARETS